MRPRPGPPAPRASRPASAAGRGWAPDPTPTPRRRPRHRPRPRAAWRGARSAGPSAGTARARGRGRWGRSPTSGRSGRRVPTCSTQLRAEMSLPDTTRTMSNAPMPPPRSRIASAIPPSAADGTIDAMLRTSPASAPATKPRSAGGSSSRRVRYGHAPRRRWRGPPGVKLTMASRASWAARSSIATRVVALISGYVPRSASKAIRTSASLGELADRLPQLIDAGSVGARQAQSTVLADTSEATAGRAAGAATGAARRSRARRSSR